MHECMHGLTVVCVCGCVCVCGWVSGSVDLFAGWSSLHSDIRKGTLRIAISLQISRCKS